MTDVLIPKLGMSMIEGVLSEWLVADGAEVAAGQDLYALETDKSVQEVQSPVAGRLTVIGVPGETYQVGDLIARIS